MNNPPTNKSPKISVITPSYNQGKYIRETIESVLKQGYPNLEHIVIDGGSTDETVSILKSYPHLQWVSEKDNGQSDALNKGFQRATGDIIGWINSDDWYAENIFHEVVNKLESYPIIMGACELRDKNNQCMYQVPNKERNWFDLLKYWVPYSIPTQPSIFFRKELLEAVKRPGGSYIDPELYYCMDYDLWLRMCLHYPLTHRIDKILSYYRMTEDNKTGDLSDGMAYAEPEMSRVFNRYKNVSFTIERELSFVIPVNQFNEELCASLEDLYQQSVPLAEVVCADFGLTAVHTKELKKFLSLLNSRARAELKPYTYRLYKTGQQKIIPAINEGINNVNASLVGVLSPGNRYNRNLTATILSTFGSDKNGLAISVAGTTPEEKTLSFNKLLFSDDIPLTFIGRKIAFLEVDGLNPDLSPSAAMRKLFKDILESGWAMNCEGEFA